MPRSVACRRALVAATVAITCALSAHAATSAYASASSEFPVGGPAMSGAYDQAVSYWQQTPCKGQVTITWAPMDGGVNALADWKTTDTSRPDQFFDCRITFNETQPYD